MRPALALIAVAALAACNPLSAELTVAPDHKAYAKQLIAQNLLDPESARWGTSVAFQVENGAISVCQLVNAANAYGGMTGEQFVIVDFKPGFSPRVEFGDMALIECGRLMDGTTYRY